MADRYWVGGSGNWDGSDTSHWASSSGGAGGVSVPTSTDNVIFDANSGTSATVTVTSTSALASAITINKSDLTLLHGDAGSTISGVVTLTAGTLNTNGQTCTWGSFVSTNSNTRTLTLGASALTITGTGNGIWDTTITTNYTLTANAGTSTITFSGAGAGFRAGGLTYYNILFSGSGNQNIANGLTCNNLTRTGTAVKTDQFTLTANAIVTVTGMLTLTGNSTVNRLQVVSNTLGSKATISAANTTLTNVDWRDITAAGTATPFTGTSMGDTLGNTNITFDAPTTQTWQGTSGGSWSDVSKWTSRVPLPQDDVVISSAFSASQTLNGDMPRLGRDINFTGSSGSPTWSVTATAFIYGSLNLTNVGTVNGNTTFTFAGRGSHTITSAGKSMALYGNIAAPGATYSLQDAMQMNNLVTAATGLTFETNSHDVTINNYQINNGTTVNMGTGTWRLNGSLASPNSIWNVTGTGAVVNASNATIIITLASANSRTFTGANKTYGTLTYNLAGSTGALVIAGSNTFNTINFSDANNARTLQFSSGSTTTVHNFNVNGTAGRLMTINASTPGSPATLSKPSGTVSCSYLSIQDSTATGGASWYAGANSVNVSGNSGWIFGEASYGQPWFSLLN